MAKGFTDSKGNFRPTGNSSRSSSKEKSLETSGIELRTTLNPQNESGISKGSREKIEKVTNTMNQGLVLDEREINFIKNTMNRHPDRSTRPEVVQEMLDATWNEDGHEITASQNEKGREWLNRKPQRDRMGAREAGVMDDFKEIRLIGITETHSGTGFYIPFWRVIANDGSTFEYRNIGAEISIDG